MYRVNVIKGAVPHDIYAMIETDYGLVVARPRIRAGCDVKGVPARSVARSDATLYASVGYPSLQVGTTRSSAGHIPTRFRSVSYIIIIQRR